MGKYFDYSDWKLEDITDDIRERIADANVPVPPKKRVHKVGLEYRVGDSTYTYEYAHELLYREFREYVQTYKDAVKFLDAYPGLERYEGDTWTVKNDDATYFSDKEQRVCKCHFCIREYDVDEYVDGKYYIEYSDEERKALSNALHAIELARVYLDAYDRATDNGAFGHGDFAKRVDAALRDFNIEYTEKLPDDYYETESDL